MRGTHTVRGPSPELQHYQRSSTKTEELRGFANKWEIIAQISANTVTCAASAVAPYWKGSVSV